MANHKAEIRSFRNALDTYLTSAGFSGLDFREEFPSTTITVPSVAIHYLPTNKKAMQIGGKSGGEDLLSRTIQVDVYMESKDRADVIVESIMDFIELTSIAIVDKDTNTVGSLICWDDDKIYGDTLAPILTNPQLLRWRGIVRAPMEAHYFGT